MGIKQAAVKFTDVIKIRQHSIAGSSREASTRLALASSGRWLLADCDTRWRSF